VGGTCQLVSAEGATGAAYQAGPVQRAEHLVQIRFRDVAAGSDLPALGGTLIEAEREIKQRSDAVVPPA
jgi:hypothetical protein